MAKSKKSSYLFQLNKFIHILLGAFLIIGFFLGAQYMKSRTNDGNVAGLLSDPYEYERITVYGDLDTNEVGRDDATLYFYLPDVPLSTYSNVESIMVNVVPHQYINGDYVITAKDNIERDYVGFGCYTDDQQGLIPDVDYSMRRANGAAGPTDIYNYIFTLKNKNKITNAKGCLAFGMENLALLRVGTFDIEVSLQEKDNIDPTHVGRLTLEIVEKNNTPLSPSPTIIPSVYESPTNPEPTSISNPNNEFETELFKLREKVSQLEDKQIQTEKQVEENTNLIIRIMRAIQEFFQKFKLFS